MSDTILDAESARKVEKEVKAIIRAELRLNKKKKEQLFKADKENKDLAEKNKFLKNRTEFLEEENESLEVENKVLKDERDRLLPFERESHKLRQQNEQFEISKLIRKYKNIKFKDFFPRCNHTVGAACAPKRRNGEYKCPLEHNF